MPTRTRIAKGALTFILAAAGIAPGCSTSNRTSDVVDAGNDSASRTDDARCVAAGGQCAPNESAECMTGTHAIVKGGALCGHSVIPAGSVIPSHEIACCSSRIENGQDASQAPEDAALPHGYFGPSCNGTECPSHCGCALNLNNMAQCFCGKDGGASDMPITCGLIGCANPCTCTDVTLSACTCPHNLPM